MRSSVLPLILLFPGSALLAQTGDLGSIDLSDLKQRAKSQVSVAAQAVRSSPALTACTNYLDPAAPPSDDASPLPEAAAAGKLAARDYPSVFQAWVPSNGSSDRESVSRHDLVILGAGRYAQGNSKWAGLSTAFKPTGLAADLRSAGGLVLAEIRYHDAKDGYLPPDHPWWLRQGGDRATAVKTGVKGDDWYLLDFTNPCFQEQAARQCRALLATGLFDGCFLDRWAQEDDSRLALLGAIRRAIGDGGMILVNSSQTRPARSAPLLNGIYFEPSISKEFDWTRAAANLEWAATALPAPSVTALEVWGDAGDGARMRAATTLSLTLSDGSVLYSRPDRPGGGHEHDWTDFWSKGLGKPRGPGAAFQGGYRREFDHGTAVYNPPGNTDILAVFDEDRRSRAKGTIGRTLRIAPGDGDIFVAP